MAKELPYFKFEPGAWISGRINFMPDDVQGVFIRICAHYWQRLGDMDLAYVSDLCDRNATALQRLLDRKIIHQIGDKISIEFLDEQLNEFDLLSKKNAENAKLGWEKRKNATALPTHSDRNAIREDKSRKEERKKEDMPSAIKLLNSDKVEVFETWIKYRSEIKKPYKSGTSLEALAKKFNQEPLKKCSWVVANSIQNSYQGLFWENYRETNGVQVKTFETNR